MNIIPFSESKKRNVVDLVINAAKKRNVLPGLQANCSSEYGVQLPLTSEWRRKVMNEQLYGYEYLKYHDSRQLRFSRERVGSDCMITGLYTQNGIPYFSSEELETIKELINEVSKYAQES